MTNPSEEIYVNTTGIRTGALGFTTKSDEITSIAGEIAQLLDPGALLPAVGDNKSGPNFAKQFIEQGHQLRDGVTGWGTVVRATGANVTDLARMFEDVENGGTDATHMLTTLLHTGITQVNGSIGPETVPHPKIHE